MGSDYGARLWGHRGDGVKGVMSSMGHRGDGVIRVMGLGYGVIGFMGSWGHRGYGFMGSRGQVMG